MINQRIRQWLVQTNQAAFSAYAIIAAFSVYLTMYAFRKPFEAPTYEGMSFGELEYKILLILTQVLGYMLSKFSGIKIISEMSPGKRVMLLLTLISIAQLSLLGFALTPYPYNFPFLFFNGLPLGLVWGIVFSFLEGRRLTELLGAGLCASFIIGSGVVKSVGLWLIQEQGVDVFWMPFLTGLIFAVPMLVSVWLLSLVPPPSAEDIAARTERVPMSGRDRWLFFKKLALGLTVLIIIFVFLTAYRDFRDKFSTELWAALGYGGVPSQMAKSETLIGVAVTALMALVIFIRNNRGAFWTSMGILFFSGIMVGVTTWGFQHGKVDPEVWMIFIGFWMYLSYVAYHVTVFERLITVFKIKSNIGFLMYLADAFGYLGSVSILLYKNFGAGDLSWLQFFVQMSYGMAGVLIVLTLVASGYFYYKIRQTTQEQELSTLTDT